MTIPGTAGTPAPDSRLLERAQATGRAIVDVVDADRRPSAVMTRAAFRNAIVTLAAVGGSTNAVVHLLAIAGRLGVDLTLDDFDRIGRRRPAAGGPAAGRALPDGRPVPRRRPARRPARGRGPAGPGRHHRDGPAARRGPRRGQGLGCRGDPPAVRRRSRPMPASRSCAARSRPTAPSSSRRRPRRICSSIADGRSSSTASRTAARRLADPDLDVDEDAVLVLRGCGPKGYPGHARGRQPAAAAEAAGARRPRHGPHLRRPDERHGVRHGRAARRARGGRRRTARRWSGPATWSSSTCRRRRIDVDIPADELAARASPLRPPSPRTRTPARGWERLYIDHVRRRTPGPISTSSSGAAATRWRASRTDGGPGRRRRADAAPCRAARDGRGLRARRGPGLGRPRRRPPVRRHAPRRRDDARPRWRAHADPRRGRGRGAAAATGRWLGPRARAGVRRHGPWVVGTAPRRRGRRRSWHPVQRRRVRCGRWVPVRHDGLRPDQRSRHALPPRPGRLGGRRAHGTHDLQRVLPGPPAARSPTSSIRRPGASTSST